MTLIVVVGATRGLGASIIKQYAGKGDNTVYGTTRSSEGPKDFSADVKWLPDIDLMQQNVGEKLADLLEPSRPIDILVSTVFPVETAEAKAEYLIFFFLQRSSQQVTSLQRT
jgi:NAD(P)-dependent dehydrogenase (short-subunit alcohol dehydrogenase family)